MSVDERLDALGLSAEQAAAVADLIGDAETQNEILRTQLREAQTLSSLILGSSRDCVVVLDLEGNTLFVSPGGIESMEVSDVGAILGLSWLRVWKGADHEAARAAVASARAGGTGRFEGFCATHRGTPKWWDVVISPMLGSDGQPERLVSIGRDITDRRLAEATRLEQQAELRLVADALPVLVAFVDRHLTYRFANSTYKQWFGLSPEQLVGRTVLDIVGEAGFGLRWPYMERALAGEPVRFDAEWPYNDGRTRMVDIRYLPRRDAEGEVDGFHAFVIDITERKRTERTLSEANAALAASEGRLRAFMNAMPNQVWTSAADGQLDWFNDQVYRYAGGLPGELDGAGWTRMVHPDDLDHAAERWQGALRDQTVYETEFRLRRSDGSFRWHIARAVPIRDADGVLSRWIGTNTDIEDQKAAAQQLARLNETLEQQVAERTADRDRMWRLSTDLMLVAAFDTTVVAVNPAWTTTLGWSEADVVGRSFMGLVHPDDHAATLAEMGKLGGGLTTFSFENRARRKDGTYCTLAWTAVPDEGFIHAVGRDVTAEREAADALRSAEEQLRQSQKMEAVGQLTGGLAHDFNNLLAGISGSLEMMQARLSQGRLNDLERYVGAAQGAAKRAAALTHRLLAFSRRQTLTPKATDVNRLASSMEDLIRRTVGPHIDLEIVAAGGLWSTLVDPNQLENALLNLCINARDAMPEGGRLTVETANRWLDDRAARQRDVVPGQYVSLCVSDTGTGMAPEIVARAFDPFFTTKPIGMGTGLGLSMIYGFAKQSGGQVKIYSEVGQGTMVCIYLPRHRNGEESVAPADAVAEVGRAEAGETVLVVDDEPTVRMLVADVLDDLGYVAIEATDGAAGLKILQSNVRIDLLISDVGLPGPMNGRQMADAARVIRPDLKVLFITGYAENAVLSHGHLEPGMQVLTKPFAMDLLGNRIRLLIEGS
ncbi:MAG TPA: PAS domain S-box protein [Lichenihabitans sp.]|nr:PAS domain S-box protein [Lichenihabitans sp.]